VSHKAAWTRRISVNLAQRLAAARQQPHRLPLEFIRELATRYTHLNRHSPDSCRVVRQFAPFPRFRQSCAVGAAYRWGWNEPAPSRALKIAEFSVIEAHLSREFGSDA
jgi:hypothetical protein